MGKRRPKLSPLGDPRRRRYALPHVVGKQVKGELKALKALTPEQVAHQLRRAREALQAAGLEGEA